jgi:signal peptidase I
MTRLAQLIEAGLAILVGVGLAGAIVLQLVGLTGRSFVVIAGGSMAPALPLGAAALIEPVTADAPLAIGDVVTVRLDSDHAVVSHRVIRLVDRDGAMWMETQGDANADPDAVLVTASAVVGRVRTVWPAMGRLLSAFTSPAGFQTIAGLSGALYAISLLLRRLGRPRDALVGVDQVRRESPVFLRTHSRRPLAGVDRREAGPGR